jgi:hemoglobin-like flavoprotein
MLLFLSGASFGAENRVHLSARSARSVRTANEAACTSRKRRHGPLSAAQGAFSILDNNRRNRSAPDEIRLQHTYPFLQGADDWEAMMTPEQIRILLRSLPTILAVREPAAACFHEHLLRLNPAARPLFAGADMRRQGAIMIGAIAAAAKALDSSDPVRHAAAALCQLHVSYGIDGRHVRDAGTALVHAFEEALGHRMDPALADAWRAASQLVGEALLDAPHPMAA